MITNSASAIAAYQRSVENAIGGEVGGKKKAGIAEAEGTGDFGSVLKTFVGDTVASVKTAEKAAAAGAAGKANLQEVVLAVSQAEVMMQTVSSIRDKVISAYQDIIRMPI